jgi:ribosomal protein S4
MRFKRYVILLFLLLCALTLFQPDDYRKYNQLCGSLRQLAHRLANLDPADPFRRKHEDLLLEKLHDMGILGTGGGGKGKMRDVEHKVTVSAFARRRLPVVMTRLRMADTVQAATKFIEQGGSFFPAQGISSVCQEDRTALAIVILF